MAPIATEVPKIIFVACRTIGLFGRLADPARNWASFSPARLSWKRKLWDA